MFLRAANRLTFPILALLAPLGGGCLALSASAQVAPPISEKPKGKPAAAPAKPGAEKPAEKPAGDPDVVMQAQSALAIGDFGKAFALLDQEISRGNPDALFIRGQIFETGRTGKPEPAKAADLYKRGMLLSHPECVYAYARFLLLGAGGVEKDEAKGRQLVKQAAEKGVADAQVTMGAFAESGQGTAKDEAAARTWYEKAVAKKSPEAFLSLARFYDQGLAGLTKDVTKATDYIRESANLGSVVAANEMGVRYQKGLGLTQDNVAAIGWFNLAAQKGLPAALVNLGNCYETGNGVVPDYQMAAANYSAAARQNTPVAWFLLGALHDRGLLGPRDPVAAYIAYVRAVNAGHSAAQERRDALKSAMTPAQLADAESKLSAALP